MKKPVTFRFDQELLDRAKLFAKAENRTLTNFLETLMKDKMAARRRLPASSLKAEPLPRHAERSRD
jgi:hypothetical protein